MQKRNGELCNEYSSKIIDLKSQKFNNLGSVTVGELKSIMQQAANDDIMFSSYVQEILEMSRKKELLQKHPYRIWQGRDGKWRTYLPDKSGKRIMKKYSNQKAIEDVIINYYKSVEEEKKKDYSFRAFWERWKEKQVAYGVSNNTLTKYKSDYERFFVGTDFERKDVREINEEDITAFVIQQIKAMGLKERTGKALMGYISGVFKHARISRVISENPCEYVETKHFTRFYNKSAKRADQRIISQKDLDLLVEQLHISQEQKPQYIPSYAVELAVYTGMRIGEIAALKWEDVREDVGVILIRRSEKHDRVTGEYIVDSTKTGRERQFPISEKISKLFRKVKKTEMQYGFFGEFVFQNENGKLHSPSIAHCIRYKCIQAGIPEKSIHALRRTLNSKLRCAGVSAVVASSLFGHTEEVNEDNYTYDISGMDYKREIISKII